MAIGRTGILSTLDELDRLRSEMDRIFDQFTKGSEPLFSRAYPAVNVTEEGDQYYVRAEIPGVKPENLDISVVEGRLLIQGERRIDSIAEGASYHRREREGGTFRRTIPLPGRVDPEKVTARLKNGVLVVRLPKAEEAKPKKITVAST